MRYAAISKDWNPALGNGDWYHVSDIGKSFDGQVLSEAEYAAFEAEMVASVMVAVASVRASEFTLMGSGTDGEQVKVGRVNATELPALIVTMIRGDNGSDVRVEHEALFVHPGHDSRLYLGSDRELDDTKDAAKLFGLRFDQGLVSPWLLSLAEEHGSDAILPWPRPLPNQ